LLKGFCGFNLKGSLVKRKMKVNNLKPIPGICRIIESNCRTIETMLSLPNQINNQTKEQMANLLEIENRKIDKAEKTIQLFLLIGIIALCIDDILEDKYQSFVFYYLISLASLGIMTFIAFLIKFQDRKYIKYSINVLTLLWFISSPLKFYQNHEHSGYKYYMSMIIGSALFIGLVYYMINYKKFIKAKPWNE
jgi:hypothetical protein